MPALSYHFHITWSDIETMPRFELDAYLLALEDLNRQLRR